MRAVHCCDSAQAALGAARISASNYGVLCEGPSSRAVLRGCDVTDCSRFGVAVDGGAAADVSGGSVSGCREAGVTVQRRGSVLRAAGLKVAHCALVGFDVAAGGSADLERCTISNVGKAGVQVAVRLLIMSPSHLARSSIS
jgi:Right handed beta helix region